MKAAQFFSNKVTETSDCKRKKATNGYKENIRKKRQQGRKNKNRKKKHWLALIAQIQEQANLK